MFALPVFTCYVLSGCDPWRCTRSRSCLPASARRAVMASYKPPPPSRTPHARFQPRTKVDCSAFSAHVSRGPIPFAANAYLVRIRTPVSRNVAPARRRERRSRLSPTGGLGRGSATAPDPFTTGCLYRALRTCVIAPQRALRGHLVPGRGEEQGLPASRRAMVLPRQCRAHECTAKFHFCSDSFGGDVERRCQQYPFSCGRALRACTGTTTPSPVYYHTGLGHFRTPFSQAVAVFSPAPSDAMPLMAVCGALYAAVEMSAVELWTRP
ncbi:hypothetical protein BC628DRAFT_788628 [Trametes gibbosa]|nr:hypothetical protein BC628DRAFT_788628 [Trametes gibbosa]